MERGRSGFQPPNKARRAGGIPVRTNLPCLKHGDRLIVSELSRLVPSTGEVIQLVMVTIFSLLAELERTLISERTKVALYRAKAGRKKLAVPQRGWKIKTGRQAEIGNLVEKGVTRANIVRLRFPTANVRLISLINGSPAFTRSARWRKGRKPMLAALGITSGEW